MAENVESYTKTFFAKGMVVTTGDLANEVRKHKHQMLKMPRIPSILTSEKKYPGFEIDMGFSFPSNMRVLLLDNLCTDKKAFVVKIKLKYEHFTYKEVLQMAIPSHIEVPSSFQVVGKILHLNLKDEQVIFKDIIAKVLLDKVQGIETVIRKISRIDKEFRNFEIELLAGKRQLKTIHLENSLKFFIDYERVYWNSRLQGERTAFLSSIQKGDVVLDPFCGVGPLVVPALAKGCLVYCNDLNPVAIGCLKENLRINKVQSEPLLIGCEDAEIFMCRLKKHRIDYFIFNLPERSLKFVKCLQGFNLDAQLCCYFFCKNGSCPKVLLKETLGIDAVHLKISAVRGVSPSKKMYKLEASLSELLE